MSTATWQRERAIPAVTFNVQVPLVVRPEQPHELQASTAVVLQAFHTGHQARIVNAHRHRSCFDRELSLVALYANQIVGHALFVSRTVRILGRDIPAVNLVSLAIKPTYQGRGIGSHLLSAGHAIARNKGFVLCFVVGDPAYYCRFGYRSHAFGSACLQAPKADFPRMSLAERPVRPDDGTALCALWQKDMEGVAFCAVPSDEYHDWISPNPNIQSSVFLHRNTIVGYTRQHIAHPLSPLVFLASSPEVAGAMVRVITEGNEMSRQRVSLPYHTGSAFGKALSAPRTCVWDSALVLSLVPNLFDTYYAEMGAGMRQAGSMIWPVEFEVD